MPDRPVVSVIVPTRDCLARLPAAIASIEGVARTEIVVLDDDSEDGSRDWLARAAQADPRLRVLVGPGAGPAKARNMAISAARGRLLAFLDAEDLWHADKLATQVALHTDNPDLAFSFTDYRDVGADGPVDGSGLVAWPWFHGRHGTNKDTFLLEDDALAQIFAEPLVRTSTVVARTDLVRQLGGFDPSLPATEDWDLWLRLAGRGKVACVPRILADLWLSSAPRQGLRRRVIGIRMIGERHGAAAERLNPRAPRIFSARLLNMEADVAAGADRRWRAAWLRTKAWRQVPNGSSMRAAISALQRAMTVPWGLMP